jgi:hypothetical protein
VAPQAKSTSPPAPEPVTVSKDLHALASLMFGSSTSNLPSAFQPAQALDEVYKSYCRVTAESHSPAATANIASISQEEEPVVPFWQQKNQQQYLQTQQLSYEYKYDYHDNSSIRIEYAPVRSGSDEKQQQATRIEIDTDFPAPVIQPVSALFRSQRSN